MGRLHLKTAGGAVIGFTLPLHEAIEGQWTRGELQRVTADGDPWEGDQYDVTGIPGGEAPPAGDAVTADGLETPEPVRPAASAPKQAWLEFAVAVGAVSEEEAAGMTRADLIKASTPPEMLPLDPGD